MIEAKIDPDKKIMFFLFFVLIAVGIGYTYSYFSSKDESDAQTITTGTLSVSYVENESGIINSNNIMPIDDELMESNASKLSFSVQNTGNIDARYEIKLSELVIDDALISEDFKWALYSNNELISSGNFASASTNNDLVLTNDKTLLKENSSNYILYIWISETGEDQSIMKDKTFSSKVVVSAIKN